MSGCVGCGGRVPVTIGVGAPRKWCERCLSLPASKRYDTKTYEARRSAAQVRSKNARRMQRYYASTKAFVGPPKPTRAQLMVLECSCCKRRMPRGNFRRNGGGRRASWCKECRRPYDSAHQARRRGAKVFWVRPGQREYLWQKQGGLCAICRQPLLLAGAHVDHRIPVVKGGEHREENLQLTHALCNLKKSIK